MNEAQKMSKRAEGGRGSVKFSELDVRRVLKQIMGGKFVAIRHL